MLITTMNQKPDITETLTVRFLFWEQSDFFCVSFPNPHSRGGDCEVIYKSFNSHPSQFSEAKS